MKFLLKYWPSIVSTLAFCLSLYASVVAWNSRHRKPVIRGKWIYKVSTQYNVCLSIYNPSSIPTTIQNIKILVSGGNVYEPIEYPLALTTTTPRHYLKKTDGVTPVAIVDDPDNHFSSTDMPINIDPYKAKKIIVPFQFVNDTLEELGPHQCTLSVTINNGSQINSDLNVKKLMISQNEFRRLSEALIK